MASIFTTRRLPAGAPEARRAAGACSRSLFGRLRRDQRGTTAVEFGLVAAPFLVLVFGLLEIFILSLAQQMLETAAEQAGRLILTGNAQSLSQTQFQQKVCSSIPALLNCNNIMVDVQVASNFSGANTSAPTITYNNNGTVSNQWQYNTGSPGQVVVMRLMYQWPVFNLLNLQLSNLPTNSRLLMATAVFRNEP